MEEVQPTHERVLGLEDRTFHRKALSKLYLNSKFNISGNFNFVLSTSYKFWGESKLSKGCPRILSI